MKSHPLRPGLPALTPRIAKLPIDERGYPVPWFVAMVHGKYDFRVVDPAKRARAIVERLCWVCGGKLGSMVAFVAGPMCGVNRVSAEPPLHRDCACWSVKACPFLVNPDMVRRENNLPAGGVAPPGIMIKRNPGVTMIWETKFYGLDPATDLFRFRRPDRVTWWREARAATRAEVLESIASGMPRLEEVCASDEESALLLEMVGELQPYIPAEA